MQTITKKELAEALAADRGMKKFEALRCVDALFHGLREALLMGGRIEIRGFGAWEVRETNARPRARNPRTGEAVHVPARKKVMFKPGRELKQELVKPV